MRDQGFDSLKTLQDPVVETWEICRDRELGFLCRVLGEVLDASVGSASTVIHMDHVALAGFTVVVALLSLRVLQLKRQLACAEAEAPEPAAPPEKKPKDVPHVPKRIGADTMWPLADIDAYLIDLDGTIYSPSGPIPGAAEFYASVLRHKPHVFLSNTGAKGAEGVRAKLARNGIIMGADSQRKHVYTAAQAQCAFMIDNIPHGARVFVIAGGDADGPGSYWMKLLRAQSAELVKSWSLKTRLSDDKARDWAAAAAAGRPVFVVLFSDGSISAVTDPSTGEAGFADWSYDVIKKTSFVLAHGAKLIATAEDAFNPSVDGMPLPGPGMLVAMFRKLLHPFDESHLHVCGKGGREGSRYMVEHALDMLREQGFTGDASRVLIVGDRFDTDIAAGTLAGLRTCLVESGCHAPALQPFYPDARADYVAASIAELIPPNRKVAIDQWRKISFDVCTPTVAAPQRPRASHDNATPVMSMMSAHAAVQPTLARQSSDGSSKSLRIWHLGQGNLVYSAVAAPSRPYGPLILMLRTFFEDHARKYKPASNAGSSPTDALPTIAAADALEAMRALGVSPPTMSNGRPLHAFPFDVTSQKSRVTFAQLCRAVQRSLEMRTEANSDGGAPARSSDPVWGAMRDPSSPPRGTGAPLPLPLFARPQPTPRGDEAPAALLGRPLRRRSNMSSAIKPSTSDTSLETLEKRWQGPAEAAHVSASSGSLPSFRRAAPPASRQVRALVDQQYRFLGNLPPPDSSI